MLFEVRTRNKSVANGTPIEADSVVAVIDTNLDADNLESMIRFGGVIIQPASGQAPVERVPESTPPTIQSSVHDPDALNNLDREEDEEELAAKAKADEEAKEKAAQEAEQAKASLAGLAGCSTERVQAILVENGIKTKDDVRKKIEEKFDFQSLDGIGKAAAAKIVEWAAS